MASILSKIRELQRKNMNVEFRTKAIERGVNLVQ